MRRNIQSTEDHTACSRRHDFQDRLIDVDAPNRVRSGLMGHKFKREKHGKGATLVKKLEWLNKIQLKRLIRLLIF